MKTHHPVSGINFSFQQVSGGEKKKKEKKRKNFCTKSKTLVNIPGYFIQTLCLKEEYYLESN